MIAAALLKLLPGALVALWPVALPLAVVLAGVALAAVVVVTVIPARPSHVRRHAHRPARMPVR